MLEIIIVNTRNPQKTQTVELAPEDQLNQECSLGRDERCCIVLNDTLASRTHGKIAFRNGSYFYSDIGSRNGSKINNEDARIDREYLLKSSDTIALGDHLLWIKAIATEETDFVVPQLSTPEEYMPLATMDIAKVETWTKGTRQIRCMQIIDETVDVKTFIFVAEPPVKFDYQPGQFLTLNLDIDGKNIKRSYSISSTPSRPHTIEITVKRVLAPNDEPTAPPGLVSNWLHDNFKVGDRVEVDAPVGKFTNFVNPSTKLLLISAGSGITPMMSMSRWICDTASSVDIVFFHSARSPKDIIFRQELEMMTSRYPNFKLAITVTRPVPGQPWYGYRGRINEAILPAIAPDYQDRTVYVCGPNSFMESVKELLQNVGLPMENYYEESFGGAKKKRATTTSAVSSPDQTSVVRPSAFAPVHTSMQTPSAPATSIVNGFTAPISLPDPATTVNSSTPLIVLSESGREIACDGEEAILDVAEAAGIDMACSCRMGACGACKVRIAEGEVVYDGDVSCDEGYILACVARPVGKVVIKA